MPAWTAWLALSFVGALAGTWALRRYALAKGLMDQPGQRRSHAVVTPRGGGMSIVLVVLLAAVAAAWLFPPHRSSLLGFAAGLVVVAGIGWWDDHRPLSAALRLAVHALASAWLGWLSYRAGAGPFEAMFAAGSCVVLINVWNFMDGINGLAASQALLAAAAFALVLPFPAAWIAVALAGACMGFLPFNFPKARIFMGDGGSGSLGYVLAALMAWAVLAKGAAWWWAWVPLTAFLVDAGFTLVARMLARQRWWEPHAQHVYQGLARKLQSHGWVTFGYGCFSVFALVLFLLLGATQRSFAVPAVGAWLAFAMAIWFFLRKGLRDR
ncbi:MraY family glycosyltransferase [[Pseudomonas] boreopolis]|uniref:LPS biosynthesis protein n=1 Tax=Xanthomonas boreopolis TaxID=86183 RepID=A0A919F6Y5_9XANT|nr:LPS biosynthesis protein [[Pseudomonas] boreopolis]